MGGGPQARRNHHKDDGAKIQVFNSHSAGTNRALAGRTGRNMSQEDSTTSVSTREEKTPRNNVSEVDHDRGIDDAVAHDQGGTTNNF